ncbi:CBS domain-containing protein [Desulforhopalus singaporensis]|uniref:CBS domain-containing protein n=1 Tax=Desulforhopalus singaporensis TaxID=91360 RepID=A0A1H0SX72_9BACT|nr:CBS domain-containing protein [Desulforhopalus singaporensis]SDP46407.1 CBS domain-containing protein [Desulforhopalus singaporensis]
MKKDGNAVFEIVIPLDQYPHLYEHEPLGDAVAKLLGQCSDDGCHLHYDELFILDSENCLVGHLSIRDILISFFPSLLSQGSSSVYAGKKEQLTDLAILLVGTSDRECQRQVDHRVGDYMTRPHRVVEGRIHPLQALEIMIKDKETTLPVVDRGMLLGAVRMMDLFRYLGPRCTLPTTGEQQPES